MLYIVPTPIGNLEDFTYRGLKILKKVDLILVENFRTSKKLFDFYNIKNHVHSYNVYNEHKITPLMIKEIRKGKQVALISNAGTPGISDPGYLLIKHCINHSIPIDCLPGATAFIPALVNSGLSMNEFTFIGFLPKKKRNSKLENLSREPRTIIIYESPHRLLRTLNDIKIFFGLTRNIVVCKEISKIYQKILRGNIQYILHYYKMNKKIRGEYTIVIEKNLKKDHT
ncbi:16S rRNA (cytidine(1402)-2'-O)-methyltransferase [Blattabacterium cuenoti]|uniref:16S rRNA (cytidine(1402)-2'-O)-methyltransferase n=1 Tax=Blattabacterium cuenoti TaxID=1653831 RepID=UPI00163C0DA3|nr:16S rRNA (cytidine(1402)-2'-O)-methyltransferase [Blattabacterium cuenoti]